MELYENPNPALTRWIVKSGLLSSPLVLIDIGCQGGEHPRWRWLDDWLELHGFDPLEEVIQELRRRNRGAARKHFYPIALGNENGDREIFIQQNACATSFYLPGDSGGVLVDEVALSNRDRRTVPIRKLDTLFAEGLITRADFIKLDCEGFEPEILRGAQNFLQATGPLGIETETNFHISPVLPRGHIFTVADLIVEHRLVLFDLALYRAPRAAYAAAAGGDLRGIGQPGTLNALFLRDFVQESRSPASYLVPPSGEAPSSDAVLKATIVMELYGLIDCAYETITKFAGSLSASLDIEKALALLLSSPKGCRGPEGPLLQELNAVYNSTSWRMTAPLRAVVNWLRGRGAAFR